MSGTISQQFLNKLLDRVNIVTLIDQRVSLTKVGRLYHACCPFHVEKKPSFVVSPDKQLYHCLGCGAHGTAIDFLMESDGLSFFEAVEALAALAGIDDLGEIPYDPDHDPRPMYGLLEQVATFYRAQLHAHPDSRLARDYLAARGLSSQMIEAFGIGFAPPAWDNVLRRFGQDDKSLNLLAQAGLTATNKQGRAYDRMRGRIIFPIHDLRGRVIGFGGRLLGDGKPKYLNSPETLVFHKARELYGLYQACQGEMPLERVLVVEGYMDVVSLTQYEIRNAVATQGTAATIDHLRRLYRICNEVVFCFDGDQAGRQAAWKALETVLPLMKEGRQARFLFLPEGDDPDTLVRKIGRQAFLDEVERAPSLADFLVTGIAAQYDPALEVSESEHFVSRALSLLSRTPHSSVRRQLVQLLADRIERSAGQASTPRQMLYRDR